MILTEMHNRIEVPGPAKDTILQYI